MKNRVKVSQCECIVESLLEMQEIVKAIKPESMEYQLRALQCYWRWSIFVYWHILLLLAYAHLRQAFGTHLRQPHPNLQDSVIAGLEFLSRLRIRCWNAGQVGFIQPKWRSLPEMAGDERPAGKRGVHEFDECWGFEDGTWGERRDAMHRIATHWRIELEVENRPLG